MNCFKNRVMVLNWFRKRKYQQLNQTPRKYSSFSFFLSLLFLIAILNLISPCDGRGGNLFTIVYAKLTGTYNNTYAPLTEPYKFQIDSIQMHGDDHINMNVIVSSVSKITCVLNETHISPQDIRYEEGKDTRFYIRTQTPSTVSFKVTYLPGVEQRLFCKLSGLLYQPYHVAYFQSNPFNISYDAIQMESFHQTSNLFYFTYVPKKISWSRAPTPLAESTILCQWDPLSVGTIIESWDPEKALFVSRAKFPLNVFVSIQNQRGKTAYCAWLSKENTSWRVRHVNPITVY